MSAVPDASGASARRSRAADAIAGFLAAASIAVSLVGIAYRPARLTPITLVVALIAARMTDRNRMLAMVAVGVAALAWFVGMIVAVVTNHPVY